MDPSSDSTVVALTGQLAMVLLIAVPLAMLVSLILLGFYLRAVKRSMARRADPAASQQAAAAPADTFAQSPPSQLPQIVFVEPGGAAEPRGAAHALARRASIARWQAATIYVIAGLGYGATMAALYLYAHGIGFLPVRFAFTALCFAWPLVLSIGLVAAISWRGWLATIGVYALILAVVVAPTISEQATWSHALLFWALISIPGTLIVLPFLARRIRAVGPMVLAFMIAFVGGATVHMNLIGTDLARIRMVVEWTDVLGLDAVQTIYAMMLTGALLLGAVGWVLLRALAALYRARKISDQSMIVDSIWFMFAVKDGMDLAFAGPRWFLAAFGAFAVYKGIAMLGYRAARRRDRAEADPRLLLLRVFSLGKRSERLFDRFGKLWRYVGSIHLIAGPDLAKTTVEPHEFLEFLTGRLARRFITGPDTLARRFSETKPQRDFDGRYRVSDFFCHDDTWKMVLRRLARESDAVLMDLRGFEPSNKGCIFEINELFNVVPLDRIVFVIDSTTDEAFLRETFARSWLLMQADSPNLRASESRIYVCRLAGSGYAGVPALVRGVAAAASRSGHTIG
ncbi:MAG TPA: hypothetical protein VHG27_01130 [Xanthobacteraceae bacterium]|nr:hypothetical protein [Xanthobacteraceae bacterium]